MNKIPKLLWASIGYIGLMISLLMTSCTSTPTKPVIVVSIAPERFFVQRIVGDAFEVNLLVPPGSNPELYDPTPRDIASVAHAQFYFYMGSLPFERVWLSAIEEQNPNIESVDVSKYLPELTFIHTHDDGHVHGDPHFWSSIEGAKAISRGVYEVLMERYPDLSEQFASNYQALLDEIEEVETRCATAFEGLARRSFVIYHPSLSYFAHEWDLEQLCIEQHGKEPSPAHLASLIDEARSKEVEVVFIQREFDVKNAEIVAKELNARIVEINPLDEDWVQEMHRLIDALTTPTKQ